LLQLGLVSMLVVGCAHKAKEDLSPLAKYRATQSYEALIRAVTSKPVPPGGFTFVALGDTRSNFGAAQKVMQAAASEKPAFIFNNGDLVRAGTVSEYTSHHMRLVEMVAPIPVIPVPGNHEEGPNKDFAGFKAIYGGERFSFDYGGARFVGFNNSDAWGVDSDDLAFLERELSKPGVKFKFVMAHFPPRFMQSDEDRGFSHNATAFHKLMVKQHVNQVFVGHVHGYASEMRDGVRYTISGGGGATLATHLGPEGDVHNYIVVHVGPDALKTEVVREKGEEWKRAPVQ
jgi:3',5'-cyclic AMP phosphodiesterase CpdA